MLPSMRSAATKLARLPIVRKPSVYYGARSPAAMFSSDTFPTVAKLKNRELTLPLNLPIKDKRATQPQKKPEKTAHTTASNITMSLAMIERVQHAMMNGIDLLVCDMAGTTVEEGGAVYETLRKVMVDDGMDVTEHSMHPWHGAKKEAVIAHFALLDGTPDHELEARIVRVGDNFIDQVKKIYFAPDSNVRTIRPNLKAYFTQLRARGVKVALDTGYPPELQVPLVEALNLDDCVDSYISSYQVSEGRPYPYMIHQLMERLNISDVRRVAKCGDSVRDIEMGKNAGCGLVIGVLSGADGAKEMLRAGADVIAESIVDVPLPENNVKVQGMRLPDYS